MHLAVSRAVCTLFLLASCGSALTPGSYASRFAEGERLGALIDREEFSEPANLPTNGSATYGGIVGADLPEPGGGTTAVVGDIDLTADFRRSIVRGAMDNFISETGTRYDGSLIVGDAAIRRNIDVQRDFTYENPVAGRLSGNGRTYDMDGLLQGDFVGPDQRYVAGFIGGRVIVDGSVGAFDGEFVGRR